jgi:hypothetical protein
VLPCVVNVDWSGVFITRPAPIIVGILMVSIYISPWRSLSHFVAGWFHGSDWNQSDISLNPAKLLLLDVLVYIYLILSSLTIESLVWITKY